MKIQTGRVGAVTEEKGLDKFKAQFRVDRYCAAVVVMNLAGLFIVEYPTEDEEMVNSQQRSLEDWRVCYHERRNAYVRARGKYKEFCRNTAQTVNQQLDRWYSRGEAFSDEDAKSSYCQKPDSGGRKRWCQLCNG